MARSAEGQELATLCLDLGYKLAPEARDLTRTQINFLMAALALRAEASTVSDLAEQGVTRIVVRDDLEGEG